MWNLRNVLLTLHILAAIVTIGWLATQSMIAPGIIRRGPANAAWVRASANFSKKFGPMSSLVFLLGIWLVLRSDGVYKFSQTWLSIAVVGFIAATVIGAVFIGKAEHIAATKLEAGETAEDEARKISILGGITMVILVVIVYCMVAKPGL